MLMNILSRLKRLIAPSLIGRVGVSLLLFFPLSASGQFHLNFGNDSPIRKLQVAEMAITNLYVDSVDENKLVEDAIRGMIEKLDPHSAYSTAKETKAMNEPLQGSFEGIGVQFNMVEDTLLVIQPTLNGPSEKVGILAGDRIISVNDTAIAGVKMSKEDIMKRLRGKKGSKVRLGVVRRGIGDVLSFTVTRDKIPVHTLDAAYMIKPGVGYIRIGSFGATTYEEFMEALQKLRNQGALESLVLDLQDNGGGYLQAAAQIANEFLQKDDIIVYTEGRSVPRQDFRATGDGHLRTGCRIVVLVNEYSASAAEIVTGALQDQDRGQVVGRRTFGKGLVQRPIEFPDGSMIRLTVAHYFTPSGRCIQKPYVKGEKRDYEEDIEKRFKHGELYSQDSIHFSDSLRYETLRLHRTVYGGGGIMPDYFVPLDRDSNIVAFNQMYNTGLLIEFAFNYANQHKAQLQKQYPDAKSFVKNMQVSDALAQEFIRFYANKEGKVTLNNASNKELRIWLKALIGRNLYRDEAFYPVINSTDKTVLKAVEVMKNDK